MIHHRGPISGVDAHASGYLATAGYDNAVILWNADGKAVSRGNHDHLANQCRFSPDGSRLVSASSDHSARLWAIPSMDLLAVLRGHDDDVEMAAFSPCGRRIVTASRDHTIGIFDDRGTMLARLWGHTADVISIDWSAGGETIISSSDDGTVRTWDARSHLLLDTVDLGDVEADSAVRGADGTIYVGTDRGSIVMLRGTATTEINAHRSGIKRLILDQASRTLVSSSYDRTLQIWTLDGDGVPQPRIAAEAPAAVWLRSMALLDAHRLALGSFGAGYALLDLPTGTWDLSRVGPTPGLNALCLFDGALYSIGDAGILRRDGKEVARVGGLCNFLHAFGNQLLCGGHLGVVQDACTAEVLYRHHSPLNCATAFTRDGRDHVAIGSYTGEAIVLRRADGGSIEAVAEIRMHPNAIKGLANNGETILSVCATGAVAATPVNDFSRTRLLGSAHTRISNGVASSSEGWFASVGRDQMLRFWNANACRAVATPHDRSIKCLAICPDTNLVATGSYSGVVAIYCPLNSSWVQLERLTTWGISAIIACGSGQFCAASYDGEIYEIS